jgi:hypothetical protein
MASKQPYIIELAKRFWQAITLVDTDGVPIGSANPLPVSINGGGGGASEVKLIDEAGNPINKQNPIDVDGESVHVSDIDFANSDFTNWVGDPENMFKSPFSASIVNSTSDNPKIIDIAFNRTVKALQIGLGENNGGDFSNIKISLLGSGGTVRALFDNSSDNTKITSKNIQFNNELFNKVRIEFAIADTVSLSNITIQKSKYNVSQIQGEDNLGRFQNVKISQRGSLNVALQEYQSDAFGRLRVSEPFTIFDNSLTTAVSDSLFWSTLTNGTASGSYVNLNSRYDMSVLADGDYIVRQTKQRFKYQPGKSHAILITGLFGAPLNTINRVGYLDYDNIGLATITNSPQNGVCFQNNSGILNFCIYNNGVLTESVSQANWNVDKLDGTGDSEFILDVTSTNIFFIDMEWLGVGAVRVGFVSPAGQIIVAHIFQHASNGFSDVYMRTANLPISYSLTSTGGSATTKQICSSVFSEGGFNPKGIFLAVQSPIAGTTCSADTLETILGVRLQEDSFEFSVEIDNISVLAESSGDGRWYLLFNPTLVGTPTWADVPNSVLQQSGSNLDVSEENLIVAGGTFSSDTDAFSSDIQTALRLGKDLLGNLDEVWLAIYPYTTEVMHGFVNLRQNI